MLVMSFAGVNVFPPDGHHIKSIAVVLYYQAGHGDPQGYQVTDLQCDCCPRCF